MRMRYLEKITLSAGVWRRWISYKTPCVGFPFEATRNEAEEKLAKAD